jgi:hypothetical protein
LHKIIDPKLFPDIFCKLYTIAFSDEIRKRTDKYWKKLTLMLFLLLPQQQKNTTK